MKIEYLGCKISAKFNKNMSLINSLAVSNILIRILYKHKTDTNLYYSLELVSVSLYSVLIVSLCEDRASSFSISVKFEVECGDLFY